MPIQTRTLQIFCKDDSIHVLSGLNEKPGFMRKKAGAILRSLVLRLQRLDKIRRILSANYSDAKRDSKGSHKWAKARIEGWPYLIFNDPRLEELNREARRLLEGVNILLFRYRWPPKVGTNNFEPLQRFSEMPEKTEQEYQENVSVWSILLALNHGRIDRFRTCGECQKWFCAITSHQRYCSEAHRKQFASRSQDFRTKRREYMRKYRQDERERDSRFKALAQPKKEVKQKTKARGVHGNSLSEAKSTGTTSSSTEPATSALPSRATHELPDRSRPLIVLNSLKVKSA